jgi:trimeric autotransporter adhesin
VPSFRAIAAACVLFGVAMCAAHADGPIGVNAAVNPQGSGTPPAGAPQPLVIGQPVVFNERIATEATGQAQLLFRDESALSVGPASDLVIDQFIYDPNAGTAKLAMSATRGVFRFVGGEVSKLDNPVTLATPSGSLGIRGGIFIARIGPNGGLTAVFVYGKEMTVTGRNGAVSQVRRPGFAVSVDRAGDSPSQPFPAPRELLSSLFGQFDGLGGPRGGAAVSDARAAQSPLFSRLAGINAAGQLQSLADRGGPSGLAAHPALNALNGQGPGDVSLSSVASQGDGRLLQVIQTYCLQRGSC